MTDADQLRQAFVEVEVNADFSEAMLRLRDESRLHFCHRVGERWAKALPATAAPPGTGVADLVLARIARFRLNAKHLDIQFADGSRWEIAFSGSK